MGRPDTLGADLYHNRQFPPIKGEDSGNLKPQDELDPPHCAIIKHMVDFSRIVKSIGTGIYLPETSIQVKVTLAHQIEKDLVQWVDSLPDIIRPAKSYMQPTSLKGVKDALWAKRQRLVLTIRMQTYGPATDSFVLHTDKLHRMFQHPYITLRFVSTHIIIQ
jgi:hypothetical protein